MFKFTQFCNEKLNIASYSYIALTGVGPGLNLERVGCIEVERVGRTELLTPI